MPKARNVLQVPVAGEIWRHWKGGEYEVVGLSRLVPEEGGHTVITYRHVGEEQQWTQSLKRWNERIPGGFRYIYLRRSLTSENSDGE